MDVRHPPERAVRAALPSVWVLECHRAGDQAQSVGLARSLGWPFELKHIAYRRYEFFPNMAIDASLIGIDRGKSSPLEPPWPDLVIFAGRRNEPVAKWIRRQSGGRARIVLIGRNWTPPESVDLVVTTPQFRLPAHPNLLVNEFPLHVVQKDVLEQAAKLWAPRLAALPRPLIALLVGGSSGPYAFGVEAAQRLGREASAVARKTGGSLLVSTSARTSRRATAALWSTIEGPAHRHRWIPGQPDNPYLGYLALADRFIVTGDSLSMMTEACAAAKPVEIFEFGGGLAAMRGPWSRSAERRWWRWSQLKAQRPIPLFYAFAIGLPAVRLNRARDIRLVQDAMIASGRAGWLGSDLSRLRPTPLTDMERAVGRVRALFAWEMAGGSADVGDLGSDVSEQTAHRAGMNDRSGPETRVLADRPQGLAATAAIRQSGNFSS